jgi:hypothetical protein
MAYLTPFSNSNTLAGLIVSPEPSDPVGLGGLFVVAPSLAICSSLSKTLNLFIPEPEAVG